MKFYVYSLNDPDTGKPFYIGKGSGDRMYQHEILSKYRSHINKDLQDKILSILEQKKSIKYKILFKTDNEKDAFDKEYKTICHYGKDNLCNRGKRNIGIISFLVQKGQREIFDNYCKSINSSRRELLTGMVEYILKNKLTPDKLK